MKRTQKQKTSALTGQLHVQGMTLVELAHKTGIGLVRIRAAFAGRGYLRPRDVLKIADVTGWPASALADVMQPDMMELAQKIHAELS